jgi:hypothetical protein
MRASINEEFNYNVSQQIFVSAQTWGTIKIVKEQTLILIKTVESKIDANLSAAEFCDSLINHMKNNGEIPHEKGLQMIRGEMELIFN